MEILIPNLLLCDVKLVNLMSFRFFFIKVVVLNCEFDEFTLWSTSTFVDLNCDFSPNDLIWLLHCPRLLKRDGRASSLASNRLWKIGFFIRCT